MQRSKLCDKGDVTVASMFDFSLAAAAARELAQRKWREDDNGLAIVLIYCPPFELPLEN
jgi:hypothetical protein